MSKLKESMKETKTNLKMSWYFIKKKKKNLIIMSILSILISGSSIILPILSAQLLLKLTNGLLEELLGVSLFIFGIEISRNLIFFFFQKITQKYMIETVTDVQMEMFQEILQIEISEMDKNSSGTFIDRMKDDTQDIINIFSDLINYFIDFLSNVGILVASFFVSIPMFFYFLITSCIIGYINRKQRNIYYERNKIYRRIKERTTGLASEFIRGLRDVKLLNGKAGILKQTKKEIDMVNQERISMEKTSWKFRFLANNVRDFFDVIFIFLGIILVYRESLTISSFLVLHMYRGRIENLLEFYNRFIDLIKKYNLSATRVYEVLGTYFKKEPKTGKQLPSVIGKIEFQKVSFAYTEEEVLKNISFTINPGERVGFVGASGSGKSTIFYLLTKLYPLEKGKILIDGIDIQEISNNSLRSNISLITQNPYIFNFTVLENLKIANPNLTKEEIIEACKKAEIYDKISELEQGFDTIVGEGGVTLSGGEKQRLAIARSLLKKSNILLFDEATSSLDNMTQDKVQKAIYGLDHNKTILIIAHRLSTVVHCDKIVMLEKGKIIDIGTHQELLKRCKKYQNLFQYEEVKNYEKNGIR